jgi:hypothetical protein
MINASAGLHLGMVERKNGRLVLTIGLPLAAGLSLRELSAVLAHELGHFRQGAGMRLSRLVWRVNEWLVRLAFERDGWDVMLVGMSQDREQHLFTRLFLWCPRARLRHPVRHGSRLAGACCRSGSLAGSRRGPVGGCRRETTFGRRAWKLRPGRSNSGGYDDLDAIAAASPTISRVRDRQATCPPARFAAGGSLPGVEDGTLRFAFPDAAHRAGLGPWQGHLDVPGGVGLRDFLPCKRVTSSTIVRNWASR